MGLPGTREMSMVERRAWSDVKWEHDVDDSDVGVGVDRLESSSR